MLLMRPLIASLFFIQLEVPPATAAEPGTAGRRLYATCAACHGTDGRPETLARLPALAGQSKEALIASMQAFKTGNREATIMHQIAKGYTDEQIELIAGYLATRKKPEAP